MKNEAASLKTVSTLNTPNTSQRLDTLYGLNALNTSQRLSTLNRTCSGEPGPADIRASFRKRRFSRKQDSFHKRGLSRKQDPLQKHVSFRKRGFGSVVAWLLMICVMICSLCGCSSADNEEYTVRVFYLNEEKTALVPVSQKLRATSVYGQTEELLDLLASVPAEQILYAPISGFARRDFAIEKNTVSLELSGQYRKMDIIHEKLTLAAVVNTLCELEEIRRVTIRVNGALIVDEHGNKSENMTADQFIYNSGSEMLNFERADIHLYFASEDGKSLVDTFRTVVFNSNIPMERLVVEQIIAGPNSNFNYPTVNENTKVVNTLTRDNICTVILDKTFLTNPYAVDPEVAVYSIVNSLTELPSIIQVQIIIDGEDNPVFMDSFTLDSETLLQKNTKIVQTR